MVDFSITTIISIIAESFFQGSTTLAGLAIMMAVVIVFVLIFASVGAPVQYALAPLIIVTIFFSYLGVVDSTVSFIIIIVCAVMLATTASRISLGQSKKED